LSDAGLIGAQLAGGMPSPLLPMLYALVRALAMMGLVLAAGLFPIAQLSTPEFEQQWSQGYRWVFLYACMALIRCKYYFGWFLAEGACIASGLGFHGVDKDGNARWCVPAPCVSRGVLTAPPTHRDRCRNVSLLMVELPENARTVSAGWNSRVALWLKRCASARLCCAVCARG
jgi:hypothetical protein